MTVTKVERDLDRLSLVLTAEFDVAVERVWELWADPRKLEQWWGPPTYPATVEEHHLAPGGSVTYFMTGPEGDKYRGWWQVIAVEPPTSLEFVDGFADDAGNPLEDMPTNTTHMLLAEHEGGTRMELRSQFESLEQMEKLLEMGMDEGLRQAVEQMDAILAGAVVPGR
jgi:uncharacterized protein YndB with AHSA1/START domain